MDDSQYKINGILRYEKIFGRGFISTGGVTTTKVICQKISKIEKYYLQIFFRKSSVKLTSKMVKKSSPLVVVLAVVKFTWTKITAQ